MGSHSLLFLSFRKTAPRKLFNPSSLLSLGAFPSDQLSLSCRIGLYASRACLAQVGLISAACVLSLEQFSLCVRVYHLVLHSSYF